MNDRSTASTSLPAAVTGGRLALESIVSIDDLGGDIEASVHTADDSRMRPVRLMLVHSAPMPQQRRAPRRQVITNVVFERRLADRRQRRPGIDGLLRTVLSDNWP